jgi:threonyl-tRNA synthetase
MDEVEKLERLRHSASHVMAQAVLDLFPNALLAIGPATADGFYYDFDVPQPFSDEDLERIQRRMKEIIDQGHDFRHEEWPKDRAREFFRGNPYKLELIDGIVDANVSIYSHDVFTDLCAGPHLADTSQIGAVKLLSVAGAYWRGDEHNPMLQRIYGTAFPTQDELDDYLARLEEAKRRDHRKLGKELDLFSIREESGPGLVLWHPKGAKLRHIIEEFWYKEHEKRGYEFVMTPHIARRHLWDTSGHTSFYAEGMYAGMMVDDAEYRVKPMNCPFHVLIYTSRTRSYKDLPIRWAELGTVYRYERAGVLHGLLRVRGFTQDDAHIFCTPDQLKDEVKKCVEFAFYLLQAFDYKEFRVDLSVRDPATPDKYLGTDEQWGQAEEALGEALAELGREYHRAEGEAVFYGPKIDIQMMDALGRKWQGTTVQFDFNLPQRFGVVYVGEDGQEHHPYMVHRALYGSIERFVGGLIEHYAGAFPFWLAPVQMLILPIADPQLPYANAMADWLRSAEGIRVEVDARSERTAKKIRDAEVSKVPYAIVVGKKELAEHEASGKAKWYGSVRERGVGDLGTMCLNDFIADLDQDPTG